VFPNARSLLPEPPVRAPCDGKKSLQRDGGRPLNAPGPRKRSPPQPETEVFLFSPPFSLLIFLFLP